jgi:hypothetical protein
VSVRWIPLVTAACGTRVARGCPLRTLSPSDPARSVLELSIKETLPSLQDYSPGSLLPRFLETGRSLVEGMASV